MGVASDIRSSLDICSNCVNCKLIVWSSNEETDKIADRSDIGTYRESDQKYHYAVHCSWLKQKIPSAEKIIKCEGKKNK